MMRQMGAGAGPGGLGRMPGGGKKAKGRMGQQPQRRRGKSGNPAKRARQEIEMRQREAEAPQVGTPSGSVFGAPQQPADFDPAAFQSDLDKYLKR